jgi:hypothetical protein
MSDAPEAIWAMQFDEPVNANSQGTWGTVNGLERKQRTEYVRKDLHDTANARIAELEAALTEADDGMGCGLEDRNITDCYEAMAFGWEQAMGRVESEIISHTQEILTVALNPTTEATQ